MTYFLLQVNLTVECNAESVGVVEEPLPAPAMPAPTMSALSRLPRQPLRPNLPRDSIGSASGLGLEPAMQATLFAFSHILRPAHSKDSLRSNSSDGNRLLLGLHSFGTTQFGFTKSVNVSCQKWLLYINRVETLSDPSFSQKLFSKKNLFYTKFNSDLQFSLEPYLN